jgi:hypothetical protein
MELGLLGWPGGSPKEVWAVMWIFMTLFYFQARQAPPPKQNRQTIFLFSTQSSGLTGCR